MSTELPPGAATTMRMGFCGHWAGADVERRILTISKNIGMRVNFFIAASQVSPDFTVCLLDAVFDTHG